MKAPPPPRHDLPRHCPPRHYSPRQLCLAALGLAVVAFLVYLPSLRHGFVNWDDDKYVAGNPHVNRGLTPEAVAWAFTSYHSANWHPLTWLSHALDVSLYGLARAWGHHLSSVLLHAANAALLLLALAALTRRLWPSVAVAALFALHPLHVESVAWVAERKDVLSTFFMLLTLLAYVRYVDRSTTRRYLLVVSLFAAALLSKPMAVTWPLVLLLLDYWPLNRLSWRAAREKLPLLAMSLASSLVTFYVQQASGAVRPGESIPLGDRALHALYAYAMYLVKTVWPAPGTLLPLYPLPDRGGAEVTVGLAALCGGLLVLLTVLAWKFRGRRPYLLVGWLIYLGMLVPVIGLLQVGKQVMADRYTYMPLVGIFIAVVWLVADYLKSRPRLSWPAAPAVAAVVAALGLGAALAGLTWAQQGLWRDPFTLWTPVVEAYPRCSAAQNSLGHAWANSGRGTEAIERAIACYQAAVAAEPGDYMATGNLANKLMLVGRAKEAERYFQKSISLNPDYAPAHNGYGALLLRAGRTAEALAEFRRAVAADPDYLPSRVNLATALLASGDYPAAIQASREVLTRDPSNAQARQTMTLAEEAKKAAPRGGGR